MYESTRKGTKAVMEAIGKTLLLGKRNLGACALAVGAVLNKVPWIDGKSRSDVMAQATQVARVGLLTKDERLPRFLSSHLDGVMKAWNRAYKRTWVRTKKRTAQTGMKLRREATEPIVFYLVSRHQKSQPAHEPLQGTVLVDRFWRKALEGDYRFDLVKRHIEKNKIHTVQWAMGEPHYLLTRPNCRHYLIPLKTNDVLTLGIRDLWKKYQPNRTGVRRPITDDQRHAAYVALRNDVKTSLDKMLKKKKERP